MNRGLLSSLFYVKSLLVPFSVNRSKLLHTVNRGDLILLPPPVSSPRGVLRLVTVTARSDYIRRHFSPLSSTSMFSHPRPVSLSHNIHLAKLVKPLQVSFLCFFDLPRKVSLHKGKGGLL